MKTTVIREIASRFSAYCNCVETNNTDWASRHFDVIEMLIDNCLPSGSGIDNGVKFNFEKSKPGKVMIFDFGYHHMDENGYYDGWTDYTLHVTPSFDGVELRIVGRDRNQIKDYLYDTFQYSLTREVEITFNRETENFELVQCPTVA